MCYTLLLLQLCNTSTPIYDLRPPTLPVPGQPCVHCFGLMVPLGGGVTGAADGLPAVENSVDINVKLTVGI